MNIKTFALLGGALLLAGCPGDDPTITDTPTETGDTDVGTPTPPPAFAWHVTLTDGDQVADTAGVADADTVATDTENSIANYPDVVEWDFGVAQTAVGPTNGWYGEDCNGVVSNGQDICHTMAPDSTMTLTRVGTIGAIVAGSTTLINVDFPESGTPGMAYVIIGIGAADEDLECFRMGNEASYFNGPGCVDYVDPMM